MQPQGYHGASPVWTPGRPGVIILFLPETKAPVSKVLASDHAHQVGYVYNQLSSLMEAATSCEDDLAAVIVSAFDYRYSRQTFVSLDDIIMGLFSLDGKAQKSNKIVEFSNKKHRIFHYSCMNTTLHCVKQYM